MSRIRRQAGTELDADTLAAEERGEGSQDALRGENGHNGVNHKVQENGAEGILHKERV